MKDNTRIQLKRSIKRLESFVLVLEKRESVAIELIEKLLYALTEEGSGRDLLVSKNGQIRVYQRLWSIYLKAAPESSEQRSASFFYRIPVRQRAILFLRDKLLFGWEELEHVFSMNFHELYSDLEAGRSFYINYWPQTTPSCLRQRSLLWEMESLRSIPSQKGDSKQKNRSSIEEHLEKCASCRQLSVKYSFIFKELNHSIPLAQFQSTRTMAKLWASFLYPKGALRRALSSLFLTPLP